MAGCVFAGSFDPISIGHLSLIEKCAKRYDKVLVVIGENNKKKTLFTIDERALLVFKAVEHLPNVTVVRYADVASDYAEYLRKNGYEYYVRGIRNEQDLAFEEEYKKVNQKLYPFIKTIYIEAEEEHKNVSSTLIKWNIFHAEDFSYLVPEPCYKYIKIMLKQKAITEESAD